MNFFSFLHGLELNEHPCSFSLAARRQSFYPIVAPTKEQLEENLRAVPKGVPPETWEEARKANPDPEKYMPVVIFGFDDLKRRMDIQVKGDKNGYAARWMSVDSVGPSSLSPSIFWPIIVAKRTRKNGSTTHACEECRIGYVVVERLNGENRPGKIVGSFPYSYWCLFHVCGLASISSLSSNSPSKRR